MTISRDKLHEVVHFGLAKQIARCEGSTISLTFPSQECPGRLGLRAATEAAGWVCDQVQAHLRESL
jgi:hypothetical protein